MSRVATTVALALAATLAVAATATANVGDITSVEIDDTLTGSADQVTVSGEVQCQLQINYGVIVKVTQPPELATLGELSGSPETGTGTQGNEAAEGVGAFGPNFEGVQDDNPCTATATEYDVVVEKNNDSGDFASGDMGVELQVGTSANDGQRGPGPIVGDLENVFEVVEFDDGS